MSIKNFKEEIESVLGIVDWEPSREQLIKISEEVENIKGVPNKSDVNLIVKTVYGDFKESIFEGEDDTDLTTLLLLATKVSNSGNK